MLAPLPLASAQLQDPSLYVVPLARRIFPCLNPLTFHALHPACRALPCLAPTPPEFGCPVFPYLTSFTFHAFPHATRRCESPACTWCTSRWRWHPSPRCEQKRLQSVGGKCGGRCRSPAVMSVPMTDRSSATCGLLQFARLVGRGQCPYQQFVSSSCCLITVLHLTHPKLSSVFNAGWRPRRRRDSAGEGGAGPGPPGRGHPAQVSVGPCVNKGVGRYGN